MSRESEALRKAAVYMREHGFSVSIGDAERGPTCFVGAMPTSEDFLSAREVLTEVTGAISYGRHGLTTAGWTDGCTDDAVAALEIAADLAE